MALPAGTVTLLFSDIEGSTRLLERLGEGYAEVLEEHRRIVRGAVAAHGGHELRTEGDAFFVVFARAGDGVRAAVAAQLALAACAWPSEVTVRVRMGLHTGEPRVMGHDYVGMDVHCAARICSAAHGGQVVVSDATERILAGEAIGGVGLQDLGEHRLKDLSRPMRLHQIVAEGLTAGFPPLRTREPEPTILPGQWAAPTALFGREDDVEVVAGLVRESGDRLVTLVGPGGVGKTRLAIEVAGRVAGDFADGERFVALAAVSEFRDLASAIARALAAPVSEGESAQAAVLRFLSSRQLLLVLDNFEQLVEGAPLVGDLIRACPGLTVLVTSREPTRLAAERLYPVRPLEVPGASASAAVELERYGAVAMFCDRARARDPAFTLDESTGPPVSEICRRLEGLPLALELAAARTGLLSVSELAARLDGVLAVLVGGARDAPKRQRTLRATIDWSYKLLTPRSAARSRTWPSSPGAPPWRRPKQSRARRSTCSTRSWPSSCSRVATSACSCSKPCGSMRSSDCPRSPTATPYTSGWRDGVSASCVRQRLISCGLIERHGWPASTLSSRMRWRRCPGRSTSVAPSPPCSSSMSWATIGFTRITPKMGFAGSMPRWSWGAMRPLSCEPARCSRGAASRTSGTRTSPTERTCAPASSSTALATTPAGSLPAWAISRSPRRGPATTTRPRRSASKRCATPSVRRTKP